jgi:hypothetical protein
MVKDFKRQSQGHVPIVDEPVRIRKDIVSPDNIAGGPRTIVRLIEISLFFFLKLY